MTSKKRKRSISSIIIRVAIAIVVILIAVFVGLKFAKKKTVEVASQTILEQVIREQIKEEHRKNAAESGKSVDSTYVNLDGDIIVNQGSGNYSNMSEEEQIEEEVQQVLSKIAPEDKETIEEIISEHLDADFVKDAVSYLKKGNIKGLKERAKQELSQDEIDTLMAIYDKYEDDF